MALTLRSLITDGEYADIEHSVAFLETNFILPHLSYIAKSGDF
jgi:hypothetical protein